MGLGRGLCILSKLLLYCFHTSGDQDKLWLRKPLAHAGLYFFHPCGLKALACITCTCIHVSGGKLIGVAVQ